MLDEDLIILKRLIPNHILKLEFVDRYTENYWKKDEAPIHFFTPHGYSHCEGVITSLFKLVLEDSWRSHFSEHEIYYIFVAALLHDVGMKAGNVNISKKEYEIIRQTHHIISRDYIWNNADQLGLSTNESQIIGDICYFHRKAENIKDCIDFRNNTKVRLLASYLRLADSINVDISRVEDKKDLFKAYISNKMSPLNEFHWLRSFWITEITPDPKKHTITISYNIPKQDKNIEGEIEELLVKVTEDEISEELDSCKDELIIGGVNFYLEIERKPIKTDFRNFPFYKQLKQIISSRKIKNTASSSQVSSIIIDTINYLRNFPDNSDGMEAYELIKTYRIEEIENTILKQRSCHLLVLRINNIIRKYIPDNTNSVNVKLNLEKMIEELKTYEENRKESIEKLANNAKVVLSDKGTILLLAYSELIVKALQMSDDIVKEETTIYVCECRNKDQYNYKNELIYSDGEQYCKAIISKGYKNVFLIPDLVAGYLLSSNMIAKVMFGANGIDLKENTIAHTTGHISIINSAKMSGVPIYIIADSFKFYFSKELNNHILERDIHWLSSKDKMNQLRSKGIQFFNPRSETITAASIYMFVTDEGVFPPFKFSEAFINKVKQFDIEVI